MENKLKRGLFIVFEGLDRTGKTTQVSLLENSLKDLLKKKLNTSKEFNNKNNINSNNKEFDSINNNNYKVNLLRFPDRSSESGKKIDQYLKNNSSLDIKTIHFLFADNRKEKAKEMKEKLFSGESIIVDRYAFSGFAYSYANGIDKEEALNADKGILRPDLVIQLDMSVDEIKKRGSFGEEKYEKEEIQKKVQENYKLFHNKIYWKYIDANKKQEEVQADIVDKISDLIDFYLKEDKEKEDEKVEFVKNGFPYDIKEDLFSSDKV